MSYDEIKLSAMMVLSSHTEFINDGSRENRGVLSPDPKDIQPRGVIMGPVGSRLFLNPINFENISIKR